MKHQLPIYIVDVLVYIYLGKEFIEEKIVKGILTKGYTKKYIISNNAIMLEKRTSREVALPKGKNVSFKIKDIQLISQHGFGVNDL